ncbi:bifunctional diaminohydroxyphosphoribosylaminopyrimidine deaminase/5-amino-6-(5-phosphoribosylamino)uracil reductase RibD [Kocuria coralli]|uniref:Riboflavin biosynthesis protein RibD n=2 Tax=Kocuria coralli TaxID=1461025 RepID=A0A5J5KVN3_9MICC|nr:bifunctional diaminohydroxyphosphoribosylaminopyrimidine deaminase/5-amino-6-(5-phosphoribosylamino)uracil reductase RibD [Kocuria coralli]
MDAALSAAWRGPRGSNPLVGAALLDQDGRVLHRGFHRGAGTEHAEVDVLSQARKSRADLSRTTLLVTLEPCNHQGRTGPCSHAVLESGIPRLIYATADTTPAASGGAAYLRSHGVEVRSGLRAEPALELNHRWTAAQRAGRPFVTVKTAQSLDGRIAAVDGTSQWITGAEARAHAHGVRGRVDAIVAGTGTILTDDPRLTVRGASAPAPATLTGERGAPAGNAPAGDTHATAGTVAPAPLRVAMGLREVPAAARVRGEDGRFRQVRSRDPHEVLRALTAEGVRHVLIEGGSEIVGAFLAADLTDELIVYQAPVLLGAGQPAYPDLGVTTLAQARRFLPDPSDGGAVQRLGSDLLWHLQPAPNAPTAPPGNDGPPGPAGHRIAHHDRASES